MQYARDHDLMNTQASPDIDPSLDYSFCLWRVEKRTSTFEMSSVDGERINVSTRMKEVIIACAAKIVRGLLGHDVGESNGYLERSPEASPDNH